MTVWLVLPSARPVAEAAACLADWQRMGYRVAVLREDVLIPGMEISIVRREYEGYAASINFLARQVLDADPQAAVVVGGSDDVFPDSRQAAELEAEFVAHFRGTYGVMQPTGHSDWSALAREVAWSPWIGREFCRRAYGGAGPLWSGYYHFWADTELHQVAQRAGVLWQRDDVRHEHRTWKREVPRPARPPHLRKAAERHEEDRELYEARMAAGWPGAEPLPA